MKKGAKYFNLLLPAEQLTEQKLLDVGPMLLFMWRSHHIDTLIRSPYFELMRVSDGCYQLIVRKCRVTSRVDIKFTMFRTIKNQ